MDASRVATLAVRIFALFIVFQGVRQGLFLVDTVIGGPLLDRFLIGPIFTTVVLFALAWMVWENAQRIAVRALGAPIETEPPIESGSNLVDVSLSALGAHAIAFTIIGVYVATQGLVRTFEAVSVLVIALTSDPEVSDFGSVIFDGPGPTEAWPRVATGVFQARGRALSRTAELVELAEFFRRNWWAGTWRAPRSSGRDRRCC